MTDDWCTKNGIYIAVNLLMDYEQSKLDPVRLNNISLMHFFYYYYTDCCKVHTTKKLYWTKKKIKLKNMF